MAYTGDEALIVYNYVFWDIDCENFDIYSLIYDLFS